MKIIFTIIILVFIVIIYLYTLAYNSKSKSAPGLILDLLSKCPPTPNCICSEFKSDNLHFIDPILYSKEQSDIVIQKIKTTLQALNGKIISENETYIAAIFTSDIFGFVDDFEIRIDEDQQKIHIRSASRVGRGDMDANKKRATEFKTKLESTL